MSLLPEFPRVLVLAALLACAVHGAAAQSLFDDFGENAWTGRAGYRRGIGIEPRESETLSASLGMSRQGRLDLALHAGRLETDLVDFALVGASAAYFFRSAGAPFVPSLVAQITRSSPNGDLGQNTTAFLLGGAATLVADLAPNLRLLPHMSVSVSKAFPDPNEFGEFEAITIVEFGATLFMKLSEWQPTGVYFAPSYAIADGDSSLGAQLGFSVGI